MDGPLEADMLNCTLIWLGYCYQPRIIWPGFIGKFCEIFDVLLLLAYYVFTYNIECLHLYTEFCVHAYTIYTYQIPVLYNVKFYTWFIFNTNSSTRFCKVERFGNSSSASLVSRAQWVQNLFEMAFIWIFQKCNTFKKLKKAATLCSINDLAVLEHGLLGFL